MPVRNNLWGPLSANETGAPLAICTLGSRIRAVSTNGFDLAIFPVDAEPAACYGLL